MPDFMTHLAAELEWLKVNEASGIDGRRQEDIYAASLDAWDHLAAGVLRGSQKFLKVPGLFRRLEDPKVFKGPISIQ